MKKGTQQRKEVRNPTWASMPVSHYVLRSRYLGVLCTVCTVYDVRVRAVIQYSTTRTCALFSFLLSWLYRAVHAGMHWKPLLPAGGGETSLPTSYNIEKRSKVRKFVHIPQLTAAPTACATY